MPYCASGEIDVSGLFTYDAVHAGSGLCAYTSQTFNDMPPDFDNVNEKSFVNTSVEIDILDLFV